MLLVVLREQILHYVMMLHNYRCGDNIEALGFLPGVPCPVKQILGEEAVCNVAFLYVIGTVARGNKPFIFAYQQDLSMDSCLDLVEDANENVGSLGKAHPDDLLGHPWGG